MNFKRLSLLELASALPVPAQLKALFEPYGYLVEFKSKPEQTKPSMINRLDRFEQLVNVLQDNGLNELARELDSRDNQAVFLISEDMLHAMCETRTSCGLKASTNWLDVSISNLSNWNSIS